MDRTACTEPQYQYNGALYLYLYLYFPYGPYGLYRASVPVQRCTLTLPIPLLPLWTVRPVQSLSASTTVHFTFFYYISVSLSSDVLEQRPDITKLCRTPGIGIGGLRYSSSQCEEGCGRFGGKPQQWFHIANRCVLLLCDWHCSAWVGRTCRSPYHCKSTGKRNNWKNTTVSLEIVTKCMQWLDLYWKTTQLDGHMLGEGGVGGGGRWNLLWEMGTVSSLTTSLLRLAGWQPHFLPPT